MLNTIMKEIKILFTSVGRRVELVQAFRSAAEELGVQLTIIGADFSMDAPALVFCDKSKKVVAIRDEKYIPQLVNMCQEEEIDLLIPTIDTDLLLLAKNKKRFEDVGTQVLISGEEEVKICRDKRFTSDFFSKCGLKSPTPVDRIDLYKGEFPCFIKPKDGSSSVNAFKVDNMQDLEVYANKIEDYIIQPYIDGREYTIDIMCDFYGKPIFITPRERLAVRSGEVLKTQVCLDEVMIQESVQLIEVFKPCGPITVQLIQQKERKENYYIEINPRFGGGAPLSMKAGADSAKAILLLLLGNVLEYSQNAALDGSIYCRYDESVRVDSGLDNCKKKFFEISNLAEVSVLAESLDAVIFDLDDTLYFEKEYVKSGFKKVAEEMNQIDECYEKLWMAFKNGKQAIGEVLRQENIYSLELEKHCLEKYRAHKPELHLSVEHKNVLMELREQGKKIGIITDGRPEGQKAKIEALGLESLVDEIIITDEIAGNSDVHRFRKPNSIAFEIMKNRLQIPFSKMVYVGDNMRKDFKAPQKLGMLSIWMKSSEGLYC